MRHRDKKPANSSLSLSRNSASILERVKQSYLVWLQIVPHIPRTSRYTLGDRIENKFIDLLESVYRAYYANKESKHNYIVRAIAILDTLKFLLQIAWEAKLVSHGKYAELGNLLDEIGRILGGWKKGISAKQNSSAQQPRRRT